MKNYLYEDENGIIHLCEIERCIDRDAGTYVAWTKCEKDIPAGSCFKSSENADCLNCIGA